MTIEPDGSAELLVLTGMNPRSRRATRRTMRLSDKDRGDLARLIQGSGYESLPKDATPRASGKRRWTDSCWRTLTITVGGKAREVRYDDGYDPPEKLTALEKGIDAILDRHSWEEK